MIENAFAFYAHLKAPGVIRLYIVDGYWSQRLFENTPTIKRIEHTWSKPSE